MCTCRCFLGIKHLESISCLKQCACVFVCVRKREKRDCVCFFCVHNCNIIADMICYVLIAVG